jgi:serine/threonine protein kinase
MANFPDAESVFAQAIEIDSAEERGAFVNKVCANNPDLRDEVEKLVADYFRAGGFLEEPLARIIVAPEEPIRERPGTFIGPYQLIEQIGRGGMGVVYRARDVQRQIIVAVKCMQHIDPAALYRFKQEFRTLADVTHPNLVTLYDLVSVDGQWLFAMEYVDGVDFLKYVRGTDVSELGSSATHPGLSAEQFGRLSVALRQVTLGIMALHGAGKLHRDIKPSNVLVTSQQRVAILDFGLAAELDRSGQHQSSEQHVVGTVAYMAPEQGASEPVSPASDWYSVGVMLYETLTGQLPFPGPLLQVLADKKAREPRPPRELVPDIPEDFNVLCVGLLRRQASARLSGSDILERLERRAGRSTLPRVETAVKSQRIPLLGREPELLALEDAFRTTKQGKAVIVRVKGCSGIGKSALVRRFLEDLTERGEAVVLTGRCYERESLPFKAFDSIVDALTQHLRRLPRHEVNSLLPRDMKLLTRVFPVFQRVEAVANASGRVVEIPDPHELRRRAFAVLRELLARLGDRTPLVLAIDDLQWGDLDSAAQLVELLRPPDPPAILLIACYRSEDEATSPCLQSLQETAEAIEMIRCRDLTIEELPQQDAKTLASMLLQPAQSTVQIQIEAIARESGGNPFFVHELARAVQAGVGITHVSSQAREVALDQVLWTRVMSLPSERRRLLEIVAVSGRPIRQLDACRAAGLAAADRSAVEMLRTARLIRTTGSAEREEIETYHDRVRETVVARLSPQVLTAHHASLAGVLRAAGQADPEVLAIHFHGAGERAPACSCYAQAAKQAADALAFDHAARLYRSALEMGAASVSEERVLRIRLAEALANAGRGAESAREYRLAAQNAERGQVQDLQRRAAEQFLKSGHVDDGIAMLRMVLGSVGMRMARSPRGALLSLLFSRLRLWIRGLRFRERPANQIAPEELLKIDICWAAAVGLTMADNIQGTAFHVRHLLLSLQAGELYRIALALAMEAAVSAFPGRRSQARAQNIHKMSLELAGRIKNPHALASAIVSEAVRCWLVGRWKETQDAAERADCILREQCTGVAWELTTAQTFSLGALAWQGEWKEHATRLPKLITEAEARGDVYAATTLPLLSYSHVAHLAADDPQTAREQLRRAIRQWSPRGFHLQHYWALYGEIETALYCADGGLAWNLFRDHYPAVRGSYLLRVQPILIFTLYMRARCAIAGSSRISIGIPSVAEGEANLLRYAERDARKIERQKMRWADPLAALLRSALAFKRGDASTSVTLLAKAEDGFRSVDMRLFAAAARRRHGQLLEGDCGKVLVDTADAWMADQGIRNPARMASMLAPGLRD